MTFSGFTWTASAPRNLRSARRSRTATSRSRSFDGVGARLNYGSNRIRFTEPVPCDSRLRTRLKLLSAEDLQRGGLRATFEATVEREGGKKPPCIAEIITVMLPAESG